MAGPIGQRSVLPAEQGHLARVPEAIPAREAGGDGGRHPGSRQECLEPFGVDDVAEELWRAGSHICPRAQRTGARKNKRSQPRIRPKPLSGKRLTSGGHGARTQTGKSVNGNGLGNAAVESGTFSGTLDGDSGPIDPDLRVIIDARPKLLEAMRRQMAARPRNPGATVFCNSAEEPAAVTPREVFLAG